MLHRGVGELGADVTAQGVTTAATQAADAQGKARLAQEAVTRLPGDASRAILLLREELTDVQLEQEVLKTTVLTLTAAMTSLMEQVALGLSGSITQPYLDKQFRVHDEAVKSRLDTIFQEIKGGGGHHRRRSQVLRTGGGHGLGNNPPPPKHPPVYRGNDLCLVPHFRGWGPSGGHDEAGRAWGAGQAHFYAVGAGALGAHLVPSGSERSQVGPTGQQGGLRQAQDLQVVEAGQKRGHKQAAQGGRGALV